MLMNVLLIKCVCNETMGRGEPIRKQAMLEGDKVVPPIVTVCFEHKM